MDNSVIIRSLLEKYNNIDLDKLLDPSKLLEYDFKFTDRQIFNKVLDICCESSSSSSRETNLIKICSVPKTYNTVSKRYVKPKYGLLLLSIVNKYHNGVHKSFRYYLKKCMQHAGPNFIDNLDGHHLYLLLSIGMMNCLCEAYCAYYDEYLYACVCDINDCNLISPKLIRKIISRLAEPNQIHMIVCTNVILLKYLMKKISGLAISVESPKCVTYMNKKSMIMENDNKRDRLFLIQQHVREKRQNVGLKLLRMILQKFTSRNMSKLILYHA